MERECFNRKIRHLNWEFKEGKPLASERGGGAEVQRKGCLRYITASLAGIGYLNSGDRKDISD